MNFPPLDLRGHFIDRRGTRNTVISCSRPPCRLIYLLFGRLGTSDETKRNRTWFLSRGTENTNTNKCSPSRSRNPDGYLVADDHGTDWLHLIWSTRNLRFEPWTSMLKVSAWQPRQRQRRLSGPFSISMGLSDITVLYLGGALLTRLGIWTDQTPRGSRCLGGGILFATIVRNTICARFQKPLNQIVG